ncbi:Glucosidase 2 subunit beta [Porphyridium purpureum]|uniref:Glucosidase 2 subunit beta n=1 Tax=Porphyridium purpureum TaxID=35688 RepID=A0A5J4YVM4_PORPP|nr:Glucosidase 2 subunit beta [Porphyridium purpureum]|eukprot:POR9126..scf209_3
MARELLGLRSACHDSRVLLAAAKDMRALQLSLSAVVAVVLAAHALSRVHGDPGVRVRGAGAQRLQQYPHGQPFSCVPLDAPPGTRAVQLPYALVNDDHCDCADGSDEPGTSACSGAGGYFVCDADVGAPSIHASFVDDGVCDCCDGSDEYAGRTHCQNVCDAQWERAIQESERKVGAFQRALAKRKRMEKDGWTLLAKDRDEINASAALDTEGSLKKVGEYDAHIEELGRLVKRWEDGLARNPTSDINLTVSESAGQSTSAEADSELTTESDTVQGAETMDVLSKWPPSRCADFISAWPSEKEEKLRGFLPHQLVDSFVSATERLCKIMPFTSCVHQDAERESFHALSIDARLLAAKSCVDAIQQERKLLLDKVQDRQSQAAERIRTLDANHARFPGVRVLRDNCYRSPLGAYEYEICPFVKVLQYEHGRQIAKLGDFKSLMSIESSVRMDFRLGDYCWGRSRRSITVDLACDESEAIVEVSEPSQCKYHMVFSTAAVCEDGMLDVASRQLDTLRSTRHGSQVPASDPRDEL